MSGAVETSSGRAAPTEAWLHVATDGPCALGAGEGRRLAERYWRSARRSVLGLVQTTGAALGPVELRVAARRGPVLIAFGAAETTTTSSGVRVDFPILGGLTAGRPGGILRLEARREAGRLALGVVVCGYTPRLFRARGPLTLVAVPYALVQSRVHARVTRRYLRELAEAAS